MPRFRTYLSIILFLCCGPVAPVAGNVEPLYGVNHPLVRSIELLYSRSNLVFPTTQYPISRYELYQAARSLERHAVSPAERDRIAAFLERIAYSPEVYRYGIGLDLAAQAFVPDGVRTDEYLMLSRKGLPVAAVQLGVRRDDGPGLFLQTEFGREFASFSNDNPLTNLPLYEDGVPFVGEYLDVTAAYLYYRLGTLELVAGRSPLHLGPSRFSSLLVSQDVPFLDAVRLTIPFGDLRLSWSAATLENRRTVGEPERGELPIGYDFGRNIILYSLQRVEYSRRRVRAGLGLQALTARRGNMLLLSDFFPVAGAFQSEAPVSNVSLVADLSIAIRPGIAGFAQAGLDELDLQVFGQDDSNVPTVFAALGGVHLRREEPTAVWDGVLEIGDTHYLWGSFEDEEYLSRAIYRRALVGEGRHLPLSSPYGPGVSWLRGQVRTESPAGMDYGLELLVRWINPAASLTAIRDTPGSYRRDADTALTERELALSLSGELGYRPWEHMRLSVAPVFEVRDSDTWVEVILSITSSFVYVKDVP